MKIAYLSGAYKNAGDFLIEKRAVELLAHVLPDMELSRFLRNEIPAHIDEINSTDAVVIGGGPIFQESLSSCMDLDFYAEHVKIPTMILGGGWYGPYGSSAAIRNYHFDGPTKHFLDKIYSSGYGFSCRDIYTAEVLKNAGFQNSCMTGCPAWYDISHVNDLQIANAGPIRKIAVSDPARKWNLPGSLRVVKMLKKRFPDAEISYIFHRGIGKDQLTSGKTARFYEEIAERLKKEGVKVRDIAYGAEGFRLYDEADLHVGYRVHAHIYNLSIRHRSVLIEEDGRGAGVNTALGLPRITAYDDRFMPENEKVRKAYARTRFYENPSLVRELSAYLDVLDDAGYEYIVNAFRLQRALFQKMTAYVEQLKGGTAAPFTGKEEK